MSTVEERALAVADERELERRLAKQDSQTGYFAVEVGDRFWMVDEEGEDDE